jgi:hypothetical protein
MSLLVGVMEKQLRKLCDRKPEKVPHTKVGLVRVFDVRDTAKIRRACIEAGYIQRATLEVGCGAK